MVPAELRQQVSPTLLPKIGWVRKGVGSHGGVISTEARQAGRKSNFEPPLDLAGYTFTGYKYSSSDSRNGIRSNKNMLAARKRFCEFYGYLLGFEQQQWAYRGCLPIISFGDPRDKFIQWKVGGGTLNALAFCSWAGCS